MMFKTISIVIAISIFISNYDYIKLYKQQDVWNIQIIATEKRPHGNSLVTAGYVREFYRLYGDKKLINRLICARYKDGTYLVRWEMVSLCEKKKKEAKCITIKKFPSICGKVYDFM